jgi:hypothetical protein
MRSSFKAVATISPFQIPEENIKSFPDETRISSFYLGHRGSVGKAILKITFARL